MVANSARCNSQFGGRGIESAYGGVANQIKQESVDGKEVSQLDDRSRPGMSRCTGQSVKLP